MIGLRLFEALKNKKITNSTVVSDFTITPQYVSNLKNYDKLNDLISQICLKYKINLNWLLTGEGEMYVQNNPAGFDSELTESIENALCVIESSELVKIIREALVEKILEKLSMPRGILSKAFNFLIYKRPLIFLDLIMSNMKPLDKAGGRSYQEHLAKAVEDLDLQSMKNILGPGFTPFSKQYMLSRVLELSEEECQIIIENADRVRESIKAKMPLFVKIPYA